MKADKKPMNPDDIAFGLKSPPIEEIPKVGTSLQFDEIVSITVELRDAPWDHRRVRADEILMQQTSLILKRAGVQVAWFNNSLVVGWWVSN